MKFTIDPDSINLFINLISILFTLNFDGEFAKKKKSCPFN